MALFSFRFDCTREVRLGIDIKRIITMDTVDVTARFLELGKSLQLKGDALSDYVSTNVTQHFEREERAAKRVEAQLENEREEKEKEREEKEKEREEKEKEREENERIRQHEIELSNAGQNVRVVSQGKSLVKLSSFRDGDDVDTFLQNYERVCDANNWTSAVGMSALQNAFSGSRVSRLITSLPPDTDYDTMKEEILKTFSMTVYDYQEKFRNSKQDGESFRQYYLRLAHYLNRWMGLAKQDHEFENLKEIMIKEQTLRSVSPGLAAYLKENEIFSKPKEDIIKLADNYQSIHPSTVKAHVRPNFTKTNSFVSSNSSSVSFQNRSNNDLKSKDNHNALVRKEDRTCYYCKKKGHIAKYCKLKSGQSSYFVKDVRMQQNVSNDSPQGKGSPSQSFHVSSLEKPTITVDRSLPVTFGTMNGVNVKILRDSGSTLVVVRKNLVKGTQFNGETAKLIFANGETAMVPKAVIYLDCPLFVGEIEAACLENVPFDVLLGNIPNAKCACSVENFHVGCGSDSVNFVKTDAYLPVENESINYVQTRQQSRSREKVESPLLTDIKIKFDIANMSAQELAAIQRNDKSLSPCWRKSEEISSNYPRYLVSNNILVREWLRGGNSKNVSNQIVLPESLREKIISIAHDSVWSAHLGIKKTQDRVLNHFYWPGCFADIRRYCQSCEICQRVVSQRNPKVPLVSMPLIGKPFHRVAIDIIGPLPRSSRGNRFVLVAVDYASKYPDAVPLRSITSNKVAEALMEIFSRVGIPSEILHDQGSNFMSSVMESFNQMLQIKSIHTSPYHAQCNGLCERFNGTLKQMLKKVSTNDPKNWDRFLCPILFAFREVPQASTGFSPFELLFGYEVRGPLFLIKENFLDSEVEQMPVVEHVLKIREQVKELVELSNKNESSAKSRQKLYYDKHARDRKFVPGDKVLILLPTSTNKLLAEWKGPYEIIERLNKVDYSVKIGNRVKTFHINMLKPFHTRETVLSVNLDVVGSESDLDFELLDEMSVPTAESESAQNDKVFKFGVNLSGSEKTLIDSVLDKYDGVFSAKPGRTGLIEYEISVDPKVKPIHKHPYNIPFHLKDKVKNELSMMLENGVIRKSNSPWAFPIVVVLNKDESVRLTVDYRDLNKHVTTDPFPMPSIDGVLNKIGDCKTLSKIDLTKSFWQIPLTENCRKYTAFVTEEGHFEFNVLPFGINLATAICNRLIKSIVADCNALDPDNCFVESFVDDIVIFSHNPTDHSRHLGIVLSKLKDAGLTVNISKCTFARDELSLLGFIVGGNRVKPDEAKVVAIRNFPKPVVQKDMRSFLGLINFYRRFYPNLASTAAPLTDTLRKAAPKEICWTEGLESSFDLVRNEFANVVALHIPLPNSPFILQTDACDIGIGAVLMQEVDSDEKPMCFISRKLLSNERNYSVIEKECLSIIWAVRKFHHYLYGRKFTIKTDHAPLQWLSDNKDMCSRRMRWSLALQSYSFVVKYIKGKDNTVADVLSRYPV